MKSRYTGIDICRLAFACLIPLLHISLPDSLPLYIVRQYVSRLGYYNDSSPHRSS